MSLALVQHYFQLKDGRNVLMREIMPEDYQAVSDMVTENFRHADNFGRLQSDARQAYIKANSVDGVTQACGHKNNIISLVTVSLENNQIIGYRLLREGLHRLSAEKVAEGKRLHIARAYTGLGLGAEIINLSGEYAKSKGFKVMTAQASGDSRYFFERIGFHCLLENVNNIALEKQGIASRISYLEKQL